MTGAGDGSDDPNLWLEEVDSERSLAWVREQTARTRATLCDGAFAADAERIYANLTRPANIPWIRRRGAWVYNVWQDADHVRGLWRRTTLDSYRTEAPDWEILLDVDALATTESEDWVWGGFTTLEPGHGLGMVRLSRGGSDAAVFREFDLGAARFVDAGFVVPEGKGSVDWIDRDTLLVASTQAGDSTLSGYARQVRRWRRGTALAAAPVVFEGRESDVAVSAGHDPSPGFVRTYYRRQITFQEGESFIAERDGEPVRLDIPLDASWTLSRDWLTVELDKTGWTAGGETFPPGALVGCGYAAFRAGTPRMTVLFRPSPRVVLGQVFTTRTRVVMSILDHLRDRVLRATPPADPEGAWTIEPVPGVPELAAVSVQAFDVGTIDATDDLLASTSDFLAPDRLSLVTGDDRVVPLKAAPVTFSAEGLRVELHEAEADDGERVPYYEVGPESRDGPRPTLLTGYGGFGISMRPAYLTNAGPVWLERGGVYVVACLRGGGEFGPAWHQAGVRERKRRSHDDFADIARDLVRRGVTVPERLAISGGSNGGLLVGNVLTRHPETVGAVHCAVPLLDMRRYTKLLAGASWIAEYGDPDDPADWAFLAGLSPYHLLDPARRYPPVLFTTQRRDDRVHPGHARKMAARMQTAGQKALFFEPESGGHGAADKRQVAENAALLYAHLRHTIGREG